MPPPSRPLCVATANSPAFLRWRFSWGFRFVFFCFAGTGQATVRRAADGNGGELHSRQRQSGDRRQQRNSERGSAGAHTSLDRASSSRIRSPAGTSSETGSPITLTMSRSHGQSPQGLSLPLLMRAMLEARNLCRIVISRRVARFNFRFVARIYEFTLCYSCPICRSVDVELSRDIAKSSPEK